MEKSKPIQKPTSRAAVSARHPKKREPVRVSEASRQVIKKESKIHSGALTRLANR